MFNHQPTHPNAFGNPANLGNLGNPASYYANGFKQSEGCYIDGKKDRFTNVENDNVVFGLRKDTFKHQPTYPNALRTTEI